MGVMTSAALAGDRYPPPPAVVGEPLLAGKPHNSLYFPVVSSALPYCAGESRSSRLNRSSNTAYFPPPPLLLGVAEMATIACELEETANKKPALVPSSGQVASQVVVDLRQQSPRR